MTIEKDAKGGYFINGKAQVMEMIQFMTTTEKEKLVKNIRPRNPQLADEIQAQALSFNTIRDLRENDLNIVLKNISAPIFGIALKSLTLDQKRNILSMAPREYAEEAYQTMTTRLNNESQSIKRAQEKVKLVLISLLKRQIIQL